MKKVVALICIISCVFTMSVGVFATEQEEVTLNVLEEMYELKTIDEVPEGIEPIELELEEVEDFIKSIEKYNTETEPDGEIEVSDDYNSNEMRILSSSCKSQKISKKELIGILLWKKLYGTIKICDNKITEANSLGMSFEGYSPGITLRDSSVKTRYDISDNGKTITLYGEGDVDYYLLIDGAIKLFTLHTEMEFDYSL
ncbi:hypothetical protein SAMN05446037_10378 [Anaerovirgula multivorans]|uniref:Uncharacterized protein n=1 Tax=Anaerovirgula multivorans TaxID=312168 RepID=A0A239JLS9_9FIRM|nr:hypothetical protein [Anaerovirgula multivorans]SNT06976.1 hypothetical protein SAMN05446037_10378 [Anaerovirgula multivorans]